MNVPDYLSEWVDPQASALSADHTETSMSVSIASYPEAHSEERVRLADLEKHGDDSR